MGRVYVSRAPPVTNFCPLAGRPRGDAIASAATGSIAFPDGMQAPSGSPRAATASELKAVIDAERRGTPFLLFRDGAGGHHLVPLSEMADRLTVGRHAEADVSLEWDEEVSRVHAELVRVGAEWTLADNGLSRNGSVVNGNLAVTRRRLHDGDTLRFGKTALIFRSPGEDRANSTVPSAALRGAVSVSDAQRRVLVALCRPYRDSTSFVTPATNEQIAEELVVSVDAVKKHLRALFEKFGLGDLPQNEKRVRLAERALAGGAVTDTDFAL
jgi:pSer/pThr/pTyr-binding forkhead associated (FHA) protein